MNKQRYREIRDKPNHIFLYYLERGGQQMPESLFKDILNTWLHLMGSDWNGGCLRITQYLDNKYQYSR